MRDAGLRMVYIGCESGDDEVLRRVNKGESYDSSRTALNRLGAAQITRSVMILNGLGGTELSTQHALNSAQLMNDTRRISLHAGGVLPDGYGAFHGQLSELPTARHHPV